MQEYVDEFQNVLGNKGYEFEYCMERTDVATVDECKGPVTLKRNETEPAGMNCFKNSSHIPVGMSFLKEIFKNAVRILRIRCEPASNDSCTFRVY